MCQQFLVKRLKEYYKCSMEFANSCFQCKFTHKKVTTAKPVVTFLDNEDRTEEYHLGRVRHFIDNEPETPIDIDCYCDHGRIYPEPVLLDGYHRLIAAVLAKRKTISVNFGGRVDLADYLSGKTNKKPEW